MLSCNLFLTSALKATRVDLLEPNKDKPNADWFKDIMWLTTANQNALVGSIKENVPHKNFVIL